ncbi:hypothetical protein, partial [Ornithobacterium rhinotracheale]
HYERSFTLIFKIINFNKREGGVGWGKARVFFFFFFKKFIFFFLYFLIIVFLKNLKKIKIKNILF